MSMPARLQSTQSWGTAGNGTVASPFPNIRLQSDFARKRTDGSPVPGGRQNTVTAKSSCNAKGATACAMWPAPAIHNAQGGVTVS